MVTSEKRLHNYGKSPFFTGKTRWPLSIVMLKYQRVHIIEFEDQRTYSKYLSP